MKQLVLSTLLCALVLGSCTLNGRIDGKDSLPIASVLHLTTDDMQHYLTDYFPTFNAVDSVTGEGNLNITAYDREQGTFTSHVTQNGLYTITVWKDGKAHSIVTVRQEANSKPYKMYSTGYTDKTVSIAFDQQPERVLVLWQNVLLDDAIAMNTGHMTVSLPMITNVPQRSFLRVYAYGNGTFYSDILIPLEYGKPISTTTQLTRHDQQSQILYSLMIDRFENGNKTNDWKMNSPEVLDIVDYQGGDIKGITQKIEEGFFDSLGISTIWISPITQNPYDAWGEYPNPKTRFSGYHGYWPIYVTALEKRFGTEDELKEMLATAHAHNMNVILDYVANHMHINSPTLQAHPDWVTDSITPDGRRNFELWDEFRLTTWFDKHIPTLDLERAEVYEPMTDSAMYWLSNFDFDGFRHDACKHIPEVYWRTLTKKIRTRFPDRPLYQIGETYGSPELIGSYIKTGMLDAQFDFNIYHTAIDVLGREGRSMKEIAKVVEESQRAYGSHHTLGNISGNHDKGRFISLAGGSLSFDEDHKAAGWNRVITVGDTAVAYKKLALLEAVNFTIPGVPCVYQGDEYGEPGGNDPDNRRMMRFSGYNNQEQDHLAKIKKLTHLRHSSLPLMYGDYLPLFVNDDVMVFARVYMGETVIAAFNKSNEPYNITVELPAQCNNKTLTAQFGNQVKQNERTLTIHLAPLSFDVIK